MLRLAGGRVESLLDELPPVEVRELPADLAVLDRLLVREVSDSLHLRRFCLLPLAMGCPMRGPAGLHRLEQGRLERIPSPLTLGSDLGKHGSAQRLALDL
jgi:hypothetical protein